MINAKISSAVSGGPTPPNYQRRFCDDRQTDDYSDKNPDKIEIVLRDGCYGDRIITPKAWQAWQLQLTSNQGDYVSVWCNEEPDPRRIVPYTGDPSGSTNNCPANHPYAEFSTEGRGVFTLVRTQTNQNAAAQAAKEDGEIAEKEKEATYKLTPTETSAGDHTGYSITIQQCFRASENIHCIGTATNLTDVRTLLLFNTGTIVDDAGNTITTGRPYFAGDMNSRPESGVDLLPNVQVKFFFEVYDPHKNVKSINIEMNAIWYAKYRPATLVFSGVPVQ